MKKLSSNVDDSFYKNHTFEPKVKKVNNGKNKPEESKGSGNVFSRLYTT